MAKKNLASAQINAFLSQDIEAEPVEEKQEAPAKVNPAATDAKQEPAEPKKASTTFTGLKPTEREAKSKRVNLLLQPSVYKEAKKQAKALGFKSFNDYINELLKAQQN